MSADQQLSVEAPRVWQGSYHVRVAVALALVPTSALALVPTSSKGRMSSHRDSITARADTAYSATAGSKVNARTCRDPPRQRGDGTRR